MTYFPYFPYIHAYLGINKNKGNKLSINSILVHILYIRKSTAMTTDMHIFL